MSAETMFAPGGAYDKACARIDQLEEERDHLRRLADIAHEREAFFAKALGVADGGVYREDWCAPLARLLDERDRLEAAIDRHRADLIADGSRIASIDLDLYAVLREIRDERDAAPGGRDEEGSEA